jgi:hypothetical protein
VVLVVPALLLELTRALVPLPDPVSLLVLFLADRLPTALPTATGLSKFRKLPPTW